MTEKILIVDDDAHLLAAMGKGLRTQFQVDIAGSGEAALAKMATTTYAVIVSDMQMPGMNGVQLLMEAQKRFPDTVRFMLTGNSDQPTAVEAVNHGHVFQFLNKPCPLGMLFRAIQAGLKQYRLINAERELLEQTLNGSIKVLADVLSLADPSAFGRGEALASYMNAYVSSFPSGPTWELSTAAMIAQIGLVTIPPGILEKVRAGETLPEMEQEIFDRVPRIGADLIANIPRLQSVSRIVLYQNKHYDGSGFPADALRGDEIPIGARILKVLADLLALETKKISRPEALALMQRRAGWYDPRVLDATFACFDIALPDLSAHSQGRPIAAADLRPGQVVLTDVQTESGKTLILARSRITPVLLARLKNFARFSPIQEPVYIEPDLTAEPAHAPAASHAGMTFEEMGRAAFTTG